ncbi:hemolysin III family protein [Lactobacillus sp. Sy-1]|uniref:PAQR family membrane homeostasis protein TrhA n=1 Tax=Lactobacillus sp. Sy-1 TaxID=2109645 RepID=UPI001C57523E|nr:hemolysin III family protein [Lactobacillus sp. Sy-1]MBW1605131.1 hemolysin III family protein [Lactobacillus sp. Sy-1]
MKRVPAFLSNKKYLLINEIMSAITHGIGVGLSIAAAIVLIVHGVHRGGAMRITTFSIYGGLLILFYLASTLFHSLYFTKAEHVFQIFDHSAIYLLIAGTYLPYSLVTIGGKLGWMIFVVIWLMAISGIVYKSIWMGKYRVASTVIYVVMGWFCVLGIHRLIQGLGWTGFNLLLAGGIAFTAGSVIYSFKRIPFGHVIWHLFVLLGTILMYFSIYFYV